MGSGRLQAPPVTAPPRGLPGTDTSHWADPYFNARYGLGVIDKTRYDTDPRNPAYRPGASDDANTRATSEYLFGKKWPSISQALGGNLDAAENTWGKSVAKVFGGNPDDYWFGASDDQVAAGEYGRKILANETSPSTYVASNPNPRPTPIATPQPSPRPTKSAAAPTSPVPDNTGQGVTLHPSFTASPAYNGRFQTRQPQQRPPDILPSTSSHQFDTPIARTPDVLPNTGQDSRFSTLLPTTQRKPAPIHVNAPTPPPTGPANEVHNSLLGSNLTPEEKTYANQFHYGDRPVGALGGGIGGGSVSMADIMGFYGGY